MDFGGKKDKRTPKTGSKFFRLVFLWINFDTFLFPVAGFSLRFCRVSEDNAICSRTEPRLRFIPHDIPSTVTGFDLSSNKISKIKVSDFTNLPVLEQIDLSFNLISQIDSYAFANLTSLKRLNLNNNHLRGLKDNLFDGLNNLTELRVCGNSIRQLASSCFKALTSLTFLDISNNRLQHLIKVRFVVQQLPKLRVLSLKKNDLKDFQSGMITNDSLALTSLDLSQNPLVFFGVTSDIFPNLTSFYLAQTRTKTQMKLKVGSKNFLSQVSSLDISELNLDVDGMGRLLGSVNSSLTFLKMNGMRHNLAEIINISCTIPTMSKLQLQHNKLLFVHPTLFQLCVNVTDLDLSKNDIEDIKDNTFASVSGLQSLTLSYNRLSSVPSAVKVLPYLVKLDLSGNKISEVGCHNFTNMTNLRKLYLQQNSISVLKDCVFKDLIKMEVLKLHNNSISILNGAFRKFLPRLQQLHLNDNKLTAIKRGEFGGLASLRNLFLQQNQISILVNGSFFGLTNLTSIQLQSNELNKHQIQNGVFDDLINLRTLDLRTNHIRYDDSSPLVHPPFSRLSHLENLVLLSQHRRGKSSLPSNILQGLTNLLYFSTRNCQLLTLNNGMFSHTPRLQTLDISSNELSDLSPELFYPIQSLENLYMSRITLRSLDFLTDANLTQLRFMQARKNTYSVISEDVIKSLPALEYVDIQGNSFFCDCDNAWFIRWVRENNRTQVFDAYNFECNYPSDLRGTKLLDFDIHFCVVDTEFICFISTTCATILLLVASFTYHFLRWHLTYAYYFFLALLFDTKNKNKKILNQYDAFVSYNAHDEPWVVGELLPKLEGEQGWRLCLHHRDFEPGKPIIDNITDAIYGSRKTICVISRRYLESEWCSREIQVASFRLFDEQKDVLILVFLEDIPTCRLSPLYRMKKLLKRKTYISWPRAQEHPEVFWEKLRLALRSGENREDERLHLTVVDRQE
ncbi:toll-like receptor 13 [Antennarius striatus]|uniref:toll-like receptor 13 n=1 Tax=Antennarius striatus TaxID=241820 RepID=UPI0035B426F7